MRIKPNTLDANAQTKYIQLRYSDPDMAKDVAGSVPPDGASVSKPATVIQASDPAQIVFQVAISITSGVTAKILGEWLWNCIKKPGRETARIERKEVRLIKRELVRLVKQIIANEDARNAQLQGRPKRRARHT
jgi:hypothetical protein